MRFKADLRFAGFLSNAYKEEDDTAMVQTVYLVSFSRKDQLKSMNKQHKQMGQVCNNDTFHKNGDQVWYKRKDAEAAKTKAPTKKDRAVDPKPIIDDGKETASTEEVNNPEHVVVDQEKEPLDPLAVSSW